MTDEMRCCPTCYGRKTFVGLGGIEEEDCTHCFGVGYLVPVAPEPKPDLAEEAVCEPAKPKRAYRKRDDLAVE